MGGRRRFKRSRSTCTDGIESSQLTPTSNTTIYRFCVHTTLICFSRGYTGRNKRTLGCLCLPLNHFILCSSVLLCFEDGYHNCVAFGETRKETTNTEPINKNRCTDYIPPSSRGCPLRIEQEENNKKRHGERNDVSGSLEGFLRLV